MWVLCILYAAPHTHAQETNILQHRRCGEKPQCHIETGVKSNADSVMQRGSQTVLWQFRNLHTTKRKNKTDPNPNSLQNKDTTSNNTPQLLTPKQTLLPSL
jgi:hypothetical protein